jgi:hypothetical protein
VLIVPECLNAPPDAVHPSRTRAPARNTEVCLNADKDRGDAHPKMHNRTTFSHRTGVRDPRTVAPRHCSTLQAICRPLKSHR